VAQGMELGATNNAMTTVQGLYAFGEVNFAYHGANRLGANALLSCIFDGLYCGVSVLNYVRNNASGGPAPEGISASVYDSYVKAEEAKQERLLATAGASTSADAGNPYVIGKELGDEMTAACTVVRTEQRVARCLSKLDELKDRYAKLRLGDAAVWTNQSLSYARALGDMLIVAEAIAKGCLERRESRGAHYRSDHPERDDAHYMKTSRAVYDPASRSTRLDFIPIDDTLIAPTARTYGKKDVSAVPTPTAAAS
jgi:succinate dehydrogenase / fumarate reductase flavoprotein subunit